MFHVLLLTLLVADLIEAILIGAEPDGLSAVAGDAVPAARGVRGAEGRA